MENLTENTIKNIIQKNITHIRIETGLRYCIEHLSIQYNDKNYIYCKHLIELKDKYGISTNFTTKTKPEILTHIKNAAKELYLAHRLELNKRN